MHILIFKCTVLTNNSCVKEYSVITNIFLWNESDDINNNNKKEKKEKKKKKKKEKKKGYFQNASWFYFYVYKFNAWLCALVLFRTLLYQINSHQRDFMWKLLLFHTEMISA